MMPKMPAPDFLVVGAPKSGTTTLHALLAGHPDVHLPRIKETHFLSTYGVPRSLLAQELAPTHRPQKYVSSLWRYRSLFATHRKTAGEITPSYMLRPRRVCDNLARIHQNPRAVRIVFLLRDPVRAMLSHYHFQYERGVEPLSLEDSIAAEQQRAALGNYRRQHVQTFRYSEPVAFFQQAFDSVHFELAENLYTDPATVLHRICSFLEVPFDRLPALHAHVNPTRQRYTVDDDTLARLAPLFRHDIEALRELTALDLSPWPTARTLKTSDLATSNPRQPDT